MYLSRQMLQSCVFWPHILLVKVSVWFSVIIKKQSTVSTVGRLFSCLRGRRSWSGRSVLVPRLAIVWLMFRMQPTTSCIISACRLILLVFSLTATLKPSISLFLSKAAAEEATWRGWRWFCWCLAELLLLEVRGLCFNTYSVVGTLGFVPAWVGSA